MITVLPFVDGVIFITYNSNKTKEAILISALKEFSTYGYSEASLRRITKNAEVTTGALYRHFLGKEDVFRALIEPAYSTLIAYMQESYNGYCEELKLIPMKMDWNNQHYIEKIVCHIYDNFDAFKLLVSASEQSSFEDFSKELISLDLKMTSDYMEKARALGYDINVFDKDLLHILIRAQYEMLFELVRKEVPRKKAEEYTKVTYQFLAKGWEHIFFMK